MKRTPLVAGNWKLHLTLKEASELAGALRSETFDGVEVCVAPVALALRTVVEALQGSAVAVAAQTCHWENQGAFTGELSPTLIADVGATHCIVGHSERRTLFGETDADVQKKTASLLNASLTPIVCVGETLEEREAGRTLDVVLGQMNAALDGLTDLGPLVFAYEPVWAIGTGRTASPDDAQKVHAAMRARLQETRGEVAQTLRILYGGSVKAANAAALLSQPDIDGALVGGASLKAETFLPIIRAA